MEADRHAAAIDRLRALAGEFDRTHPGAAASLREGLEETLTLQRLRIDGQLWRTLSSTNPIESMIEICRRTSRNVNRWQNGDMCLRWTAAGMLEAERQFRKIIGYRHLARLATAVERHVTAERANLAMPPRPTRSLRSQPSADHRTATAKFHGDRDILRPLPEPPSDAELRVVRYLSSNLTATEIAHELCVSPNTVRTHLRHIYAKLDAHSRTEAVTRLRQIGLSGSAPRLR